MSTKCPICNGAGSIPDPKATKRSQRNVRAAALLNEAGYSLREISSLLGYKSSRSAAVLISKAKKVRYCGDGMNQSNES
jgi:nanoRNase/pAp phosphatase (c-di-AMP/oligoRNAs hydrolase)